MSISTCESEGMNTCVLYVWVYVCAYMSKCEYVDWFHSLYLRANAFITLFCIVSRLFELAAGRVLSLFLPDTRCEDTGEEPKLGAITVVGDAVRILVW